MSRPRSPTPAVQYGDFAEWQTEWLAAGRLDEQLQYWKRTLARLDDPIRLPTDRPYPARLTDSGRLERGASARTSREG